MAELLAKVEAFCKQNSLFAPGTAVLAACSGGPDSLALLHLLLSLRERWQLQLAAAHFEHGIRGAASLADAACVRDFCQARGVPFDLGQADVPGYASAQQLSLETAARTLRYRFLRSTAAKLGEGTRIATAHQADDQAETVLMRILRGTGVDGLAGIAPRAGELIRPLLCATRAEIEAYCRQQGLEPRHDATNDVPDCTRNRLRLELLPQLAAEYNPDISAALCRLAAIASEESSFIASASAAAWEQAVLPAAADSVRLSLAAWRPLHPALQLALLRRAASLDGPALGLGYIQYQALRDWLLAGRTGTGRQLPNGVGIHIDYGVASFTRGTALAAADETLLSRELCVPGQTQLTEQLSVQADLLSAAPPAAGPQEILCDADQLALPILVRRRQPGDRLRIESGTKKLKELLIDAKIPQAERDRIPVFTAGGRIFWVGGVRQAAVGRIGPATRRFLRLCLVQLGNKRK